MPWNILKRFLLGTSALVLLGLPAIAQAQGAGAQADDEFSIEEIVVTSRKRGEALQDVPATVSAFTEADIESIGVSSMRDYAALVPNLFLIETQASAFTFVNIRGITQMRNLDPSVAVVIDGVLSTNSIAMSQELFDIQQIEVLKGPQGALYGRNAMGGAINITTKRPSNETEGFVRIGYGNGDNGKVQASISGPLSEDTLYGRIAVSYNNFGGIRRNVTTGNTTDAQENTSIRARLLYQPSESLELDLRASVSDDNSRALQFIDVAPFFHEVFPGGPNFGAVIGVFQPGNPNYESTVRGGPVASELFVPGRPPNVGDVNVRGVPVQGNLDGIDRRRINNVSLLANWEVGLGTVTSVSSWDKVVEFAIGEQPIREALAIQKNTQWRFSEAFSQELRLTSPGDQRLRWIAGAYIVQTDTFLGSTTQRDKSGIDTTRDLVKRDPFVAPDGICVGNPFPTVFPDGTPNPNDNQGNCIRGFDGDAGDNLAYAIFAQGNYDVTDNIEFSVSLRYDRDEREQTVKTPDSFLDRFLINPDDINFNDVRKANFDSFQPKITLRWTPLENFMTYVSYAEGFRSGGFNRPGIEALANQQRAGAIPPIPLGILDIYPQQDTAGIEGGFKLNSEDNRFVVNVSAFFTEVDNYQSFTAVTIGPLLSQVIIPLDDVELAGVEVDARAQLSDAVTVTFGFGYTDSEITRDSARGFAGNRAPQTPKTTFNAGVQYSKPVTLGNTYGSVFLRGDYQRIGTLFFMPGNWVKRKPLNLVNLRAGVEFEDSLRLEGWARNLTNRDYFAEGFNPAGFFFPGQLRTYGFELTRRF